MKKSSHKIIIVIGLMILFFSCRLIGQSPESENQFNLPISTKTIDSLEIENQTFPIVNKKEKFEIQILKYGKKGDFGTYGDGELDKPVYFLKIITNKVTIDSIEINKNIIGESTYLTKKFKLTDSILTILLKEEWEDLETGKVHVKNLKNVYTYNHKGFKLNK